MSDYEKQYSIFDSYYNPPDEDDTSYVTIFLEPGSVTDDAIAAYCKRFECGAEEAVNGLIEAGFTSLLENDALKV